MDGGLAVFWMRTGVVALGGALGAVGRYWISGMVSRLAGASLFPWGTLVVNVGGSFFIGAFLGATTIGRFSVSPNLRVFIAIGVLGALTTYSTFAYETLGALREGDTRMALANIAASLILGLGACWLGLVVGERL